MTLTSILVQYLNQCLRSDRHLIVAHSEFVAKAFLGAGVFNFILDITQSEDMSAVYVAE